LLLEGGEAVIVCDIREPDDRLRGTRIRPEIAGEINCTSSGAW
jgi:hypothetical protein